MTSLEQDRLDQLRHQIEQIAHELRSASFTLQEVQIEKGLYCVQASRGKQMVFATATATQSGPPHVRTRLYKLDCQDFTAERLRESLRMDANDAPIREIGGPRRDPDIRAATGV